MENWVIFKDIRMMRSMSNEDFPGHIQGTTCAALDNVTCGVSRSCLHRDNFIGAGTHKSREKLQSKPPAIDEPVGVDAREEASKVLIVYAWRRKGVKICVLEELDEVEHIAFCQVVGERLR